MYIDDLIQAGNGARAVVDPKRYLDVKDLGALKYFLGIEAISGNNGIYLCQ